MNGKRNFRLTYVLTPTGPSYALMSRYYSIARNSAISHALIAVYYSRVPLSSSIPEELVSAGPCPLHPITVGDCKLLGAIDGDVVEMGHSEKI